MRSGIFNRIIAIGAIMAFLLASTVFILPSEETDGATNLGFYTNTGMEGGSENQYYLGVNIIDSGLLNKNKATTVYVLSGSGIFISAYSAEKEVAYVSGSPSSEDVPSTIEWRSMYVRGTLESGDAIQVALYLQNHAWETYLTIVAVDDPNANTWPSSFTNLGNWDYLSSSGDSANLYTTMAFDLSELSFRYSSVKTFDVYMATGSTINLGCTDITPLLDSSDVQGVTLENGTAYGVVTEPGDYTMHIIDVEATIYINLHVVEVLKSVTVEFDSNGGSPVTSQIIESGDCALSPEDPSLYGYIFKGWFTDDETFLNEWDFADPVTEDMTLYAKWEGNLEFTTDPVADGKVTAVDGSPGTVTFVATNSQNYTSVLWDFGDGTSSTNIYETHYYGQPGTYTATLTVFNNYGSDTTEFIIEVPEIAAGGGNDLLLWIAVGLACIIAGGLVVRRFL